MVQRPTSGHVRDGQWQLQTGGMIDKDLGTTCNTSSEPPNCSAIAIAGINARVDGSLLKLPGTRMLLGGEHRSDLLDSAARACLESS